MLDTAQQQRIRQALLTYMQEHAIGVVKLARRISEAHPHRPEIVVKTLQRFLAGRTVNEQMVAFCDHFTSKLPHRPTIWHALGDALFALFKQSVPEGIKIVAEDRYFLTFSGPFALVRIVPKLLALQTTLTPLTMPINPRPHDGVLVRLSSSIFLVISYERLMLTPHILLLDLQDDTLIPRV